MQAKFTQGSIFKHINVMTLSSTIGLLALFLVDLADLYFLSLLGELEVVAAVGFAASILFFTTSIGIGLSIGCSALVAQVVGSGQRERTRRLISHSLLAVLVTTIPTAVALLLSMNWLLDLLGADGLTKSFAQQYMWIVLPSMPILAIAMACGGVMRALGEARSAMFLTLIGAATNAVLDPIFIFALDLGIQGAAVATVSARFAMLGFGLWVILQRHKLMVRPEIAKFRGDCRHFFEIALPAMLTNLSTPIGMAYITSVMAGFGDQAVAGTAVVGRIQVVAFAGLFALSGAIGPIAGQNLGIGQFARIRETLHKSLLFVVAYCFVACALLFLSAPWLIAAFKARGLTADIVLWFCSGFSLMFIFNGTTFVTNALFNNLRAAHVATQFNFGKATLGTMPFVYFGAQWAGPYGVFWGALTGAAITAALGVWVAVRHINKLEHRLAHAAQESLPGANAAAVGKG